MWNSYRKRLEYFESYRDNGPTWFVECNGKRLAVLSECAFVDMFWHKYRIEPLSEDEEEREALLSVDFWDPDKAIAQRYVYVNCDTGIPASNVLLGGRNSFAAPFVQVRGLWGTMKYTLRPWDRIVLWVRRILKCSQN